MFFERIESEKLAHYSYVIGDQGEAVVIDPRRDIEIYLNKTLKQGYDLKHVLETHRNEDYVIGSLELEKRTEAEIWHAETQWSYGYGEPVIEEETWEIGRLEIEALHTPGHTPGSMSYLLRDYEGDPWMIFTGDALFAGDVGRVDLLGMKKAEEMAEKLYNSLFNKILPLGDEVIVCPAHGAGSVCGTSIADRKWTTIGIEKKKNPKLQHEEKKEFVNNVAKELERPPYFKKMEELNLEGPPILKALPIPRPLSPKEFSEKKKKALVLDTRKELGYGNAHIPNSVSIWLEGIPNFAGWFLSYDEPILLVGEGDYVEKATRYLIRLGYDNLEGYLAKGMLSWHLKGKKSDSIKTVKVRELCELIDKNEPYWLLDVRNKEEVEKKRIPGAHHIHLTQLLNNLGNIPKNENIYIFCGSGLRSMTAASLLKKEGYENLNVVIGGTAGWNSKSCPIKKQE